MLHGPYARISILRPHNGDTIDFEAGYIRHLEWHRQAKDTWVWYGWTINGLIAKMTVEILNLRPTMSYGLSPARE